MKRELKICFGAIFALLFIISSFSFISLSFKVIADDAYMENLQDLSYTTNVNGEDITIKYRLWIPEDYDASVSYPMITMLHGHGGQGTDNTTQINVFKPLLTKLTTIEQQATNPCIMLIPQCRLNHKWVEVSTWTGHYSIETFDISPDLQAVVNLQDEIMSAYNVDEDRQYVTGHSMGGLATWDLISRFPTRYAAAMPIAGAGNDLEAAANITSVNVWSFHGADDVTVRKEVTEEMVKGILAAGGWAKYTEYEGVNHSSGTYTYQNESDVVNFFMSSRRGVKNNYVEEGNGTSITDVDGSDTFWFANSAPAYNSSAARDWNYIHYASFNALSVNFHSTDTTTGLKNIKFNLLSSTDMTSDKAIRIRIQTLVPAIANEALRIDLVGSTTKYMNAGTTTTLYLIENSGTTNITATGSGTGAAANVVSGASAANPKLINGYLIIPISVWGDLSGVNYLNIRTNKIYAKNIWNFGDIDYGTYSDGTFTKEKALWTAFNASGNANGFTVDDGVDAVLIKEDTFVGTTEAVWIKTELESANNTVDISGYDGIEFYVDNSDGATKKSFQLYLFSSEVGDANSDKPAYGWRTNNGLAYFIPDNDCEAFSSSFAYRSSFVPAGFKGRVYIPFSVNADGTNEAGTFSPRENAPADFPTSIYKTVRVYFNSVINETFVMKNVGLVIDATEYIETAFLKTKSINLASSNSESVMVQSVKSAQSQFELWVANKSGVFYAEGNETNEEFLGGTSLGIFIENLNNSPFVFSVKTWNNLGDITLLGGNIVNGTIKFVSESGAVSDLSMKNGYITIPAYAKGTLVLPYVGSLEVTESAGGTTTYALGYPVKHVFRIIFNAFDDMGDASYLLGKIAVINGNGSYNEIKIEDTGISELAAASEDGTYKKERMSIAYSGEVKTYNVSHIERDNVSIAENFTTANYGSLVVYTLSNLAEGDSVIYATVNDKDITEELVKTETGYTYTTVAKEDMVFACVLDSDPKDCNVTVSVSGNGRASVYNKIVKEGDVFTVNFIPNAHYRLSAVTVNGASVIVNNNQLSITIQSDTKIKATFSTINYTVSFIADGDTIAVETYTVENREIIEPQVPAKVGYTGVWEGYVLSLEDLTVNAEYTAIEYTATLQYLDGQEETVTYSIENREVVLAEINLRLTESTVEYKYSWEGLSSELPLENGKTYLETKTPVEYNITFIVDGETYREITFNAANKGEISFPSVPVKENYEGAWDKTIDDITEWKNYEITAVYKAIEYTVKFVADGETVGTVKYTVENKVITEPAVPAKDGYSAAWEEYTLTAGDITVNAVYTKVEKSGCSGAIDSGVGTILLCLIAISVVVFIKRKKATH